MNEAKTNEQLMADELEERGANDEPKKRWDDELDCMNKILYRVDVHELRILEALGRQAWEGILKALNDYNDMAQRRIMNYLNERVFEESQK